MTGITASDTVAVTDLAAYKRNLLKIRDYTGASVRLMAVVKANAYGHGLVECAQTAVEAGAFMLGVAHASEGALLRKAGIDIPIITLAQQSFDLIPALLDNNLTISLPSFAMLEELKKALPGYGSACRVHVKVDTGMGRIGIDADRAPGLVDATANTPGITVEGIFTHFPSADEDRDDESRRQIALFDNLLRKLDEKRMRPPVAHMCNSAATLKFPEAHFDMVRPGIMTFGLEPYPGSGEKLTLEPVLTLKSRITFIKDVPAGFPVSYGGTYVTRKPSRLATVPVGYADGYNRHLSNRGRAIVNGTYVPVAGRICMDQTVFDITEAGGVRVGEPIILIGGEGGIRVSVEEHADIAGTISHEIVTGISGRVSRIFLPAS